MTRPVLWALLSAAALAWVAEASPAAAMPRGQQQHPDRRAEPVVRPREWEVFPWFPHGAAATTTTTLTQSAPGPTSPSSTGASGSTAAVDAGSGNPKSSSTLAAAAAPPPAQQTSSGALVVETMPADGATAGTRPAATTALSGSSSSSNNDNGISSNRTLVITLSTVLTAVGLALIAGAVILCRRRRQRRLLPFLSRGISPIDDDEIERWKSPRDEKARFHNDTDAEAEAAFAKESAVASPSHSHSKHPSTSSIKKPPSVIIYNRPQHDPSSTRQSTDSHHHPFSYNLSRKTSLDKALPSTPIQARAPNARAGLTDESVPGDEPFLPTLRRTPSRLSKLPPTAMSRRATVGQVGGHQHVRSRSSRSSTRSFGGAAGEYHSAYYGNGSRAGSELELPLPRHSHEQMGRSGQGARGFAAHPSPGRGHSRVYSSSSVPPRVELGEEVVFGGLSAPGGGRGRGEIGRAIG
ncbi:hypothetical protein C8A05DRAFT_15702 [Staphylotrichum tortipilum]|uniref:Uncharacterized protein n=1 Tax=Staphylotrichum tortipilum TaxID=2831512 RepID=A0AAN6MJS9_9PEZI|nr:hypothetical protein C8A05DRAFT_15702 [Staphylotrichum longicolle]